MTKAKDLALRTRRGGWGTRKGESKEKVEGKAEEQSKAKGQGKAASSPACGGQAPHSI